MIGILLLKNGNRTVAAARVDSFSRFVIEHVVAVADSRKLLNDLSCTRVEDEQARRHSRHNEEPVLAFVKGHGIVGKCHVGLPGREDGVLLSINNSDLSRLRKIYIDSGTVSLKLK